MTCGCKTTTAIVIFVLSGKKIAKLRFILLFTFEIRVLFLGTHVLEKKNKAVVYTSCVSLRNISSRNTAVVYITVFRGSN